MAKKLKFNFVQCDEKHTKKREKALETRLFDVGQKQKRP
jgi:hypothetical protein